MTPGKKPAASPARREAARRPPRREILREIDGLVDDCRDECLWFLRRDYYPRSDAARRWVLGAIQKHASLPRFRQAAVLQRWLSYRSSATSAGS